MGPVVDVKFEDSDLPYISDALEVYVEDKKTCHGGFTAYRR
jgi:F-type H+-transporting ATPase subunit beta